MYDFLSTPEWQVQRNRVLRRDGHSCQICGKTDGIMHVHHIWYKHPLSEMNDIDLVSLCPDCHKLVHSIQQRMNAYADADILRIKKEWGKKLSEEINHAFPNGIDGVRKSRAISIIRGTFYEQRVMGYAVRPDFMTLQKCVKTKRNDK